MTLTELRYIVLLAQEKHFGRAADLCHVSQPTLSIAVKKLEQELDVVLFERTKSGVQPTPVGEQVVDKARRMLEQATEIKDVATVGKNPLVGALALGTLPTIGPYLLPQFIPLLNKLAADMPLYIEEGDPDILCKKLRNGELDVVITTQPFAAAEVVVQTLFDEPFVALLPSSHPLAAREVLAPDDLDPHEVLLMASGHCIREQVLTAFPNLRAHAHKAANASIRTLLAGSTLEALRHMVASGLGVTIVPLAAAQTSLYTSDVLVVRPFVSPAPVRTLVMAWRTSFPRHQAIDVLRQAVQASSVAYWRFSTGSEQPTPGLLVDNKDW